MPDPRVEEYARLLVERSLDVQPGWQVLVRSTPLARPLVEEVTRLIAGRGAYALVRLELAADVWARDAPESLLRTAAPIERHTYERLDGLISIQAPENTRDGSDLAPERQALMREAARPLSERVRSLDLAWVVCQFPCPALAQDAGLGLRAYEDILYGACLLDWDEEARKLRRIADRFDAAEEVRIVGPETDLSLCLSGRLGALSDGRRNMPGGEVFYGPIEDSAEGVITFGEFPAVYQGHRVVGARLVIAGGRVVEASARSGEDFLLGMLDSDDGARRLGELGIGCNPGITRHLGNVLFDEKMAGTIHLALGASYTFTGGTNESAIHWDMVKDLRTGGRIFCDGELVQEDGAWLF